MWALAFQFGAKIASTAVARAARDRVTWLNGAESAAFVSPLGGVAFGLAGRKIEPDLSHKDSEETQIRAGML
eukprot:CAMPEP_0198488856 /NCGR_PEP_ID=MMETSP1462-20131121/1044_1 /TAXON_ID=1333877 /ORGANISM="Brandtodinium nutriculum, Strain RCC3387" /LENGTH=71 /DNA_ID=CAMNT_0044217331 /DNA_START=9 /DNA_END=221 /DNA_ORIENTATION=-